MNGLIKKPRLIYATYKRPTSDGKTHRTESKGAEKYFMKMEMENESWDSNTYIRKK